MNGRREVLTALPAPRPHSRQRLPRRGDSHARALALLLLLTVSLLTACPRPAPPPPEGSPRLVLVVVLDQGRADYLERLRPLWSGGFARLLAEGVTFDDAHHAHAVTYTAPGHASLATGLHPGHSGIVGNGWFDRTLGEEVYCVEDPDHGTSPANLLGDTLGDWIKRRYPTARVFAASGKDRGAVLSAGRLADGAFWFDREAGTMVSSDYYRHGEPAWLEELAGPGLAGLGVADDRFGTLWEPLPVDAEAARSAGFDDLAEGLFDRPFPHALGGLGLTPGEGFYGAYYRSPFVDEMVARFGRELVEREGLGADEVPDLLALSFSALDTVGHTYGPESPEVLDVLLRLDRLLGDLFDFLDRRIGLDRVAIALSSDHGVAPLPEARSLAGLTGRRAGPAEVACLQRVGRELAERYGVFPWRQEGGFYLDREALEETGIEAEEVVRETALRLAGCPMVERVWTAAELTVPAAGSPSPIETLYRNSFHPERSPDLFVQVKEYDLALPGTMTTHGSVYRYDTHVPMVVRFPGLAPGRVAEKVQTVDLAPTLAELLEVPAPEGLDGVSRAADLR